MSGEFFNQSFTPVRETSTRTGSTLTSRRPPPPPPAPSRSNASKAPAAAAAAASTAMPMPMPMPMRSTMTNSRPTGNYYTTTTTNNNSNTATASASAATNATPFPAYNPYGSAAINSVGVSGVSVGSVGSVGNNTSNANTNTAPNPYGTSSFSNATNINHNNRNANNNANNNAIHNEENDDWFSSAQNDKTATTPAPAVASLNAPAPNHNANININANANANINPTNDTMHTSTAAATTTPAPTYMNPYATTTTTNDTSNAFSGTMSSSSSFTNTNTNTNTTYDHDYDYSNEPPLLEELGINISHIRTKSLAVILPFKYAKTVIDTNIMEDNDLAGPLVFGLLLGTELTLAGRIQYGYVYGFGLFGTLTTTLVLNLMSPSDSISVWKVLSMLGYSLLPVNFLAALNVFYRIRYMGRLGGVLAALTIGWCTLSSTRLVERGCGMRDQRFLVGYPNMLLYSAFVMLTIF
jgi:hypothetical protein